MIKFTHSQKRISPNELSEFEKKFNVKLNETHKKLLLENNGGSPKPRCINDACFDYFFSIKYGPEDVMMESYFEFYTDIPRNLVVFAGGSGSVFAYDSNPKSGELGKVYYIDESHELEYLAPSLDYILEHMEEDEDDN